jgi:hypothetical protein
MVVARIERQRQTERLSYRALCAREGVAYASLMRWKSRLADGTALIGQPGPPKVESLDLAALRERIGLMRHGRRRTAGFTELYGEYRNRLSRRDLRQMVAEERRRKKAEQSRIYHEVIWKVPRLIWAMDDTEYQPDPAYPKAYLHNVQDVGSRYKFEPLVGLRLAHGEEIAAHLNQLFETHGPPLFIKRDNGKNLNHGIVEKLLEAFLVIPVNSPCYYPQYNGGMEVAQREIKDWLSQQPPMPTAFLSIQADLDVSALNHRPRPCLGHRTPCHLFLSGQDLARTFNRRKRREVYDWIVQKTMELIRLECYEEDAAWRLAVENWLLDNGFIALSKQGKVSPSFPEKRSHD